MANIVNVDSLLFDDVLADIERFIAIEGEIDLKDFNESSVVRRFTSAMASLYEQLRMKIESVRGESIMHSAVRPDSIRYLAQSQLAYHPKRKIAPQHPNKDANGADIRFRFPTPSAEEEKWTRYSILGNLTIDDESYPISMIDAPEFAPDGKTVLCRLGVGAWRRFDIKLDDSLGHYDPFHVFHVDEDRDVIDDSGTVHFVLQRQQEGPDTEEPSAIRVINNLYEVANIRDNEKNDLALVTSNYYGGLDINFGDGLIFGNILYKYPSATVVEVHYFVTPGFIPNFNFIEDNISWDGNIIDTDESRGYSFDYRVANGINEESTAQIKTLSPYVAMSNNRIMTNDDFITRVRRIPQIKSCASRPRHIDPPPSVCPHGNPGSVSNLVPTATFELTGLSSGGVDTTKAVAWKLPSPNDYTEKAACEEGSDAWIVWHRGAVVLDDDKYWVAMVDIGYMQGDQRQREWQTRPSEQEGVATPGGTVYLWREVGTDFQPLTQMEWDLNYHQQYNFDTLLGFMRVRVLPPEEVKMTLDLKVVLKRNLDINARSHGEINELIRGLVHGYCWELGVFLDFGKMLSDIIDIHEVRHCYIEDCTLRVKNKDGSVIDLVEQVIKNMQFETVQYIHPIKLDISYQDESRLDNGYGRHSKASEE